MAKTKTPTVIRPKPLAVHVLPEMGPHMQHVLNKILQQIPEGTSTETDISVTLNGDDHQVLGLLQSALTEAQVARLRGER